MREWEALTALAEESQTLSGLLVDLEAEAFQRPTNCPPWNLKELVVHTAASIGLRDDFGSPEPGAPLLSAADYYRRPERATPQYRGRNVVEAQALATRLPEGMTAAAMFEQVWRETVATLRAQDPDRRVQVPAVGAMTSSALRVMRGVFLSLLEAKLPQRLAWDDQRLLEAATGRRTLTDQDRMILGPLQERFPLLS
jgi:hypothetical protein